MAAGFFPSAREGRISSRNNLEIFREIRAMEEAILVAQIAGQFELTINTTAMTLEPRTGPSLYVPGPQPYPSIEYWRAWQGYDDNPMLVERMNAVIKYFVDLDYSIVRKTNLISLDSFDWMIKW